MYVSVFICICCGWLVVSSKDQALYHYCDAMPTLFVYVTALCRHLTWLTYTFGDSLDPADRHPQLLSHQESAPVDLCRCAIITKSSHITTATRKKCMTIRNTYNHLATPCNILRLVLMMFLKEDKAIMCEYIRIRWIILLSISLL